MRSILGHYRFSAEYYVRVVELTEEDCEIMGLQIE